MKIVFAADSIFFSGLQVSIASLASTFNDQSSHSIDILHSSLKDRQIKSLLGTAAQVGIDANSLRFHNIDSFNFDGVRNIRGSKMAYARILIPEIFPDEKQVIYCDCDILFCKGLSDLIAEPFDSMWIVAVQDEAVSRVSDDCKWDDLPEKEAQSRYFNSGLMKMNLDLWRRHDVTRRSLEIAKSEPEKCTFWDQTILNYVCAGKVRFLPAENNLQIRGEAERAFTTHANIHFVGARKPWLVYSLRPSMKSWRFCYRQRVSLVPHYAICASYWLKSALLAIGDLTGSLGFLRKLRRRVKGW